MIYQIKFTEEFGRGLYASINIPKGTLIMQCELLVLSETDTKTVDQTDLKWYVFSYDTKRDCIVLGNAELFNHTDLANVSYKLVEFDGRKVMQYVSIRDINATEQLFINYAQDTEVNTDKYTVNML